MRGGDWWEERAGLGDGAIAARESGPEQAAEMLLKRSKRKKALQCLWLTDAEQHPQDAAQIVRCHRDQVAFVHVLGTA